ncbi:MAG: thiamine phosphate synthase [Cyclobacteriaceae bacterium]
MKNDHKLAGVYLVIDPAMERARLFPKLREALEAGVNILQLWNHWPTDATPEDQRQLINEVLQLAAPFNVPVLINEAWQWINQTHLHGVHFDAIPHDWDTIKTTFDREVLVGLTCGNDVERIRWAEEQQLDYISFCAMFPSSSVDTCEIVRPDSVLEARKITTMPVFLSGGINPQNMNAFNSLDFQGVAVISGIMRADSVTERIHAYQQALKTLRK